MLMETKPYQIADAMLPGENCKLSELENKPLRFWEIDHGLACPVVGMCLSLCEQKQLLKKAGVSIKNKSTFELHELLVSSIHSESRLSRKVDALLNRKFGREAAPLLEKNGDAFKLHFTSCFDSGKCEAVLWAAAIHPGLPLQIKRELFGEIHMAMHWSGEQSLQLKRKLANQAKKIDRLHQTLKEVAQVRRSLRKENARFSQQFIQMERLLDSAEKENSRLTEALLVAGQCRPAGSDDQEKRILTEKLAALSLDCKEKQRKIASLQENNYRLIKEAGQLRRSNRQIKEETKNIISKMFALNQCSADCPSFDLCRKRVLIVGGMTRMESLYRGLIEGSGGIFEYHDGYMKKGVRKLEGSLKRADVVVCPVNCNSHAACSIVKNLAKKHNKTVHMLASSSLSAVSQAILGARENASIN